MITATVSFNRRKRTITPETPLWRAILYHYANTWATVMDAWDEAIAPAVLLVATVLVALLIAPVLPLLVIVGRVRAKREVA